MTDPDRTPSPERARYIMIGGFLGAGKTTAVARLASHLTGLGRRVGLITNDQSTGLVDTAFLRGKGFPVEEIAGGCFCCRFDSLSEAADKLTESTRPDVFVAEPVGSCTDLVATVSYPLRRIYGNRFSVAPLSVLVDPMRAARILGLADGRSFSAKVEYVYRKQLEEADIIVVNKADAFPPALRDDLLAALRAGHPGRRVLAVSARTGTGLEDWFALLAGDGAAAAETPEAPTMELDYDRYADGEALLGWLNATLRLHANGARPFDANALLLDLARRIRGAVALTGGEIAHLKMTFDGTDAEGALSVVSLVGNETEPDLRESVLDATSGGCLILNLRAEVAPDTLEKIAMTALRETLEAEDIRHDVEHSEHFRPGRPDPTHRIAVCRVGTPE